MRRGLLPIAALAAAVLVTTGCGGRLERARDDRDATSTTASPTTEATTASTTTTPACEATLAAGRNTVTIDGVEREFLVALPATVGSATPFPVVLDFHGSGSDMAQESAYSQMSTEGPARGYVVVTPQGTGSPRGWALAGPGTDDAFVDAILAALDTGACIDRDRVFAVGISNGSAYSALMACRAPFRVAAVGMVGATLPSLCPLDHPLPAIAFHGTDDPVVPYGGGRVRSERTGTQTPGAEGAIAQWATRNGCTASADSRPAADIVHRVWTGCPPGEEVEFYSVEGGGHTWPGAIDLAKVGKGYLGATTQSVSATKVFLDLFDSVG
jgi:polyhydroxybutyrate depolymerase